MLHRLEVAQPGEAALDGGEVGQQPAEPALVDEEHPQRCASSAIASCAWRLVPTNRTVVPSAARLVDEIFRLPEQLDGLAEVDDVDPVPLAEDDAFIFGFQRFVWWPKWTPASSRSFIAMPVKLPPYQHYRLLNWKRLRAPFCPHSCAPCARVARQEPRLLEPLPQLDVVFDERPRDAEPQRAGLPVMPPPATVASTSNLSAVSVRPAAA